MRNFKLRKGLFPTLVLPSPRDHLDLPLVELEVVETLGVVLQQADEDGDQLQLLETLDVVLAHGELPQGARHRSHQLLGADKRVYFHGNNKVCSVIVLLYLLYLLGNRLGKY